MLDFDPKSELFLLDDEPLPFDDIQFDSETVKLYNRGSLVFRGSMRDRNQVTRVAAYMLEQSVSDSAV